MLNKLLVAIMIISAVIVTAKSSKSEKVEKVEKEEMDFGYFSIEENRIVLDKKEKQND